MNEARVVMKVKLHLNQNEAKFAAAPRSVRVAPSAPEFHRSEAASGLQILWRKIEMNNMSLERAKLYCTAKALVSCAHFSAGEFVSVSNPWVGDNGKIWFDINRSERGQLPCAVCYPQDHLSQFCF